MDRKLADALGRLHYGLYFLSAGSLEKPEGLLVSWVSQVSGKPPLLAVAVRENRGILPLLRERGAFALNLLPAGDQPLLASLSRPAQSRFQGVSLSPGPDGLPFLAGAAGVLFCRVRETSQPGDHVVFIAEAHTALADGPGPVLAVADLGHVYLGLS